MHYGVVKYHVKGKQKIPNCYRKFPVAIQRTPACTVKANRHIKEGTDNRANLEMNVASGIHCQYRSSYHIYTYKWRNALTLWGEPE